MLFPKILDLVHALSNTALRKFAVVHRLDRRDVSRLCRCVAGSLPQPRNLRYWANWG